MTSEELSAIRARLDAASPGPWHNAGYPLKGRDGPEVMLAGDVPLLTMEARPNDDADATLIAHAPTDLAALLAEVARLTAEVERLGAMVPRWSRSRGGGVWSLTIGRAHHIATVERRYGNFRAWTRLAGDVHAMPVAVESDLPTACAAVCERLGISYIAPPENT